MLKFLVDININPELLVKPVVRKLKMWADTYP